MTDITFPEQMRERSARRQARTPDANDAVRAVSQVLDRMEGD